MNLGIHFIMFLLYLASVGATQAKPGKITTEKSKTTLNKNAKKMNQEFRGKPKAFTRGIGPAINSNSTKPADLVKMKGSTVSSISNDNDLQKETTTMKYGSPYSGQNQQLTAGNMFSNPNGNMASVNSVPSNIAATLKTLESNFRTEPAASMQDNTYTGPNNKFSNYWPYLAVTRTEPLSRQPFMANSYQQYQPLTNNINQMETEHPMESEGLSTFPKVTSSQFVANATGFVPMLAEGKEGHPEGRPVDRFGQSLLTTDLYAAVDPSGTPLLGDSVSILPSNEWVAVDVDGANTASVPSATEQRSTVEPTVGMGYFTSQRDGMIPLYGISRFADDVSNKMRVEVPIAKYYVNQPAPARSNGVAYQGNYVYKGSPQVLSSSPSIDNAYKSSYAPSSIVYSRDNSGSPSYKHQDASPVTKSVSEYGIIGHRPLSGIESYNGIRSSNVYSENQLNSFDSALDRHSAHRTVRSSTGDLPEDIQVESSPRSTDVNDFLPNGGKNMVGIVNSIIRSSIQRRSSKLRDIED